MNWNNYDRLVNHLETMTPTMFDYRMFERVSEPGCVDCQCRILMGNLYDVTEDKDYYQFYTGKAIKAFLGVTTLETEYLWDGYIQGGDPSRIQQGREGIANALHRLREVASHYQRPQESNQADRERAFLLSCMAVASHTPEPLETVEP